ncbi:MAG: 2-hydroxy-6-oxo-6-phenylhexa-2,4-dienoate hydrolase [Herminiimonas sp.]|nr:2-hydroxy-6-oxo-6-phenylhexa-2,4-dienoate hydrolase [Herminiimonas sp.]
MAALTEEGTGKFVKIKEGDLDMQLHYQEAGSGEVVIMLHGTGPGAGGWSNWYRNFEPFVEAGYRVILLDCPGFNKSDPLVTAKPRNLINAWAVKGLMDALGIEKAHLVGNSLGGASALMFALEYPDRLDKMVLMGAGGGGFSLFTPQPQEGVRSMFDVLRNPGDEQLFRKWLANAFIYDSSKLTEELILGRFASMQKNLHHCENFMKSVELNPKRLADLSPRFGDVKAETLIVWGRDDRALSFDLGLKMLWGIPKADMVIFGQCGHWAQWEHAEKFNRIALEFLAR